MGCVEVVHGKCPGSVGVGRVKGNRSGTESASVVLLGGERCSDANTYGGFRVLRVASEQALLMVARRGSDGD